MPLKKPLTKRSFANVLLVVILLSIIIPLFPQGKTTADTGDNTLLLIGQRCQELEDIGYDFGGAGIGSSCGGGSDSWENTVSNNLGCSNSMFYTREFQTDPKDSSVTKTRWFTKLSDYKACYNKALAKYNFIAKADSVCKTMREGYDNWDKCTTAARQLNLSLGCESDMFRPVGGGYLGPKTGALRDCKRRIDAVGNVRIIVIRNGRKTRSDPIKSDSVRAEPGGGGGGGAGAAEDQDACEQGGFSLTWIICPIIEAGQVFTNFVYGELIQPLLKNIPINTDTQNGGYKAWQGFRILANIMLVGAMLILVYGMIRNGGGR
jgi:hypothetical protein